jgi:hypothetical protein
MSDLLSLQLGNRSEQTRREHKETTMDMHTTIKQITRRGGVVDNDDDDDDDDDDNDDDDDDDDDDDKNDDDGGCGGRDGHHRMRKGKGHDDRTNATIK